MLVFSEKVFEGYLSGAQSVYTDTVYADMLGSVDKLHIAGYADNPTGSPSLTVQIEHSPDGTRWMNRNATPEVNAVALGTISGGFRPVDDGSVVSRPTLPLVRLRIGLSGGTAVVRVWVAGRDPSR